MKKILPLVLFIFSLSAHCMEFEFNTMLGAGYRIDLNAIESRDDDYKTYHKKKNENRDTAILLGKVYFLSQEQSLSKFLFAGVGYGYQINNQWDFMISPFAFRGEAGVTFALDLYQDSAKGGWMGLSIGWSF